VLHQAFQHLLGFVGAYDMDIEDLPAGPLYAVGDVHVTDIRKLPDNGLFVSPGSTVPRNIAETNKGRGHGYVRVDAFDDGSLNTASAVFQEASDLRLSRFEIHEGTWDLARVVAALPLTEKHVIALVHDALTETLADTIAEGLRKAGHLVICADKRHPSLLAKGTEAEADLPVQTGETEALTFSLMAKLPLVINPERDPLTYLILSAILPDTANAAEVLPPLLAGLLDGTIPLPVPKDTRPETAPVLEIAEADLLATPVCKEPEIIEEGGLYAL